MKRAGARAVFKKSGRQQPSTLFLYLRIWTFLPHLLRKNACPTGRLPSSSHAVRHKEKSPVLSDRGSCIRIVWDQPK